MPLSTARSGSLRTGRTTLRSKKDKQERLKDFLIEKLRERNAIDSQDERTCRILSEEADRMLGKPASEDELRNAEVRVLKRLQSPMPPSGPPSRHPSRPGTERTNRSALSVATGALDDFAAVTGRTHRSGMTGMTGMTTPHSTRARQKEQNMDYWLRFTKMDVDNYRNEQQKVAEQEKRRRVANARYLDEQVKLKQRQKEAAKLQDIQWKTEVSKDYHKWQEENLIKEAREKKRREIYIRETDEMVRKKEALIQKELKADLEVDKQMLERIKSEMVREKQKQEAKKEEEKKVIELMKIQNAQMKKQKEIAQAAQIQEEKKMQKEYAKILQKQADLHAEKQRRFNEMIKQKADRMDEYVKKEKEAQGEAAAANEEAIKQQLAKDQEIYRQQMLADAAKAAKKKEDEKKMFKAALVEQLQFKEEKERLEKEEQKQAMRNLKKELSIAAKKEVEKERLIKEANFKNKCALDDQIREKQALRERARWMSEHEMGMNMNLIRKCDEFYSE